MKMRPLLDEYHEAVLEVSDADHVRISELLLKPLAQEIFPHIDI